MRMYLNNLNLLFVYLFITISVSVLVESQRSNFGLVLNTCCDFKLGSINKFEQNDCPDFIKPLDEFERETKWEIPQNIHYDERSTIVKLKTESPSCENGIVRNEYLIDIENPEVQFQSNGYLKIGNETYSDYIHPKSYCMDGINPNYLRIRSCKPACTRKEPCIRKCCDLNKIFTYRDKCIEPPSESLQWTPKLFKRPKNPNSVISDIEFNKLKPRYLIRSPRVWQNHCAKDEDGKPIIQIMPYSNKLKLTGDDSKFNARLGLDGILRYRNQRRNWMKMSDDIYCIDGITHPDAVYTDTIYEIVITACHMEGPEDRQASKYYAAFAIGSSFFALITVIVYFLLLEKQNVHGWTTMSHSTAVFFLFIFLGIAHLTKDDEEYHNQKGLCKFIAIAAHYFFLAVFSWLLVLSFDLWLTFRTISISNTRKGKKQFGLYSIFGWGFPLLFVIISISLDFVYKDDEDTTIRVPMYGHDFCYISHYFLLEYLYIPSAILFLINITFFFLTAYTLYKYQQSTKMATKNMENTRQSYMLFVKLFMVAGFLWIIELIGYFASGAHVPWYLQVLDTLNVIQPVFIFIIFVFKWEVLNALHHKYPVLRPIVYPGRELLKKFRPLPKHRDGGHSESSALKQTEVSRVSSGVEETTPV